MYIPAVLLLGMTYGRHSKQKLLYKCIPDDNSKNPILVPYRMKHVGFSKVFPNQYVLIDEEKQVLVETIGPVTEVKNYYKYQLYCKGLYLPRMITKQPEHIVSHEYENRISTRKVFSIDGNDTVDFDDAFSISVCNDVTIVSIYISNVVLVVDEYQLWNSFSDNISSIYLPDQKISMLSSWLSSKCSLTQHQEKRALVLDITIEKGIIVNTTFSNCTICLYSNYSYDNCRLLRDINYIQLSNLVSSGIFGDIDIVEPRSVVECMMRYMNFEIASILYRQKTGIFRTMNERLEQQYPSNKYTLYNEMSTTVIPYVHATSPIRRLVDILNLIQLQGCMTTQLLPEASIFYNKWIRKMEHINTLSKRIRSVQNQCSLLHLFHNTQTLEFEGTILTSETTLENEIYTYVVYLPDIRLTCTVKTPEYIQGVRMYKLYMFENQAHFRKKIRLQLIN